MQNLCSDAFKWKAPLSGFLLLLGSNYWLTMLCKMIEISTVSSILYQEATDSGFRNYHS